MTDSKFVGVFGALLCFIPGVMARVNGGSYTYKQGWTWTDGENVTIEFRIDRSKYPSECDGTPNGQAVFQSSPDGVTAYTTRCRLTDDIQTSCSFTPGTPGCGCTNSNDNGFYVIEYKFVATANTEKWWRADIACQLLPSFDPALYFSYSGGIDIVPPTVPTVTSGDGDDTGFWIAIGCLIALVIVLLIIVILQAMGIIKPRCESGTCTCCLLQCVASSVTAKPESTNTSPEALPLSTDQPHPAAAQPSAEKGKSPGNHANARDSKENQDDQPGNKTEAGARRTRTSNSADGGSDPSAVHKSSNPGN